MEPIEFLRILQRRWRVLVVCALLGVVAAVLITPSSGGGGKSSHRFKASAVLLAYTLKSTSQVSIQQDALLLKIGIVPRRTAESLHFTGNPTNLVHQITTTIDLKVGTITIATTQPTAARALAVSNTFAEQLVIYLRDAASGTYNTSVNLAVSREQNVLKLLKPVQAQIDAVPAGQKPNGTLNATYQGLLSQYKKAQQSYQSLLAQGIATARYRLVSAVTATRLAGSGVNINKFGSRKIRAVLALLAGLLLGAMLALLLDKFDIHVRTKRDAEEAFGLPVVSEVPALWPATRRRREVVTAARPISPYAEVHRILRHSVLFAQLTPWPTYEDANGHTNGNGNGSGYANGNGNGNGKTDLVRPVAGKRRQVVIVTSAGSAEGKTTTVANLAASFAESGQSVLVLSCDFHGPRIQQMLGVPDGPGISTVLRGGADAPSLADVTVETAIPGVWLAPSGEALANPPELASSVGSLIAAARELADIVIVDTPALLSVSAASELLPAADIALVVARSARTTREAAARAQERLERLGAPVLGVVLVGPQIPSVSREYSGYSRPPGNWRERRRFLRKRDVQIGPNRATTLARTDTDVSPMAAAAATAASASTTKRPAATGALGTDAPTSGPADSAVAGSAPNATPEPDSHPDDLSPKPRWRRREARRDE